MAADLAKFVNKRILKTIDLRLMQELLARHAPEGAVPVDFGQNAEAVRQSLGAYFEQPISAWAEGLVADLHRIAELGSGDGMRLILNEARRQRVALYREHDSEDGNPAPTRHEPKHVALHAYLHHHAIFEAAADYRALYAPAALAEFRGPNRDVGADLTEERAEAFRCAIASIFAQDLQGSYCRLGSYEDDGYINLVVSHGAAVSTMPVVAEDGEAVITVRAVKYAVLRYSAPEGLLRIGGVPKARQGAVAELFARHILGRPGFFSGRDARDLYTLHPITEAGPSFAFDHSFDEQIQKVRIVAAAADLFAEDDEGRRCFVRSLESKDPTGAALTHFSGTDIRFGRRWRLGEITFRVEFRTEGRRPSQVTVRLKPPGTLAFRRTRHEKAIQTLVERNQLLNERDALVLVEAAE